MRDTLSPSLGPRVPLIAASLVATLMGGRTRRLSFIEAFATLESMGRSFVGCDFTLDVLGRLALWICLCWRVFFSEALEAFWDVKELR